LYPKAGRALVAGFDVVKNPLEVRSRIGYLPEVLPLYADMEVREYLRFVGRARSLDGRALEARTRWVVDQLELKPVFRKLCRELSKGYRQRVGLAQALLHDPEIVILDEPTSGLDPHQIQEIRSLVRELGKDKTVILSTHILQEAEAMADRIVIINRGRIVGDGTLDQLRTGAHHHEKVRMALVGDRGQLEQDLVAVPGCLELKHLHDRDGFHYFEMTAETGSRVWLTIGEKAKAQGWQVGLLKDVPYTLEETFMALTKAGA
jgi:ABC-2 type transport system ATP-binding protein